MKGYIECEYITYLKAVKINVVSMCKTKVDFSAPRSNNVLKCIIYTRTEKFYGLLFVNEWKSRLKRL